MVLGLLPFFAGPRLAALLVLDAVDARHDLHLSGAQIALLLIGLEGGRQIVRLRGNLLGQPHRGFYHMMHGLVEERLLAAVGFIANCEAAFDTTMEYINDREIFGQPVAAFQNTRFKMADMRTEIDVAQAFVDQCVLQHNAGKLSADALQKLMRHRSYTTTQRYINMAQQLNRSVEKLHVPEVLRRSS